MERCYGEGYGESYDAYGSAYRGYRGGSSEPEWGTVLAGTVLAVVGGYLLIQGVTGNTRSGGASYRTSRGDTQREDGREPADQGIEVTRSVTIGKPVGELYSYWRNLENLPQIMRHLESVTMMGDGRSYWVAKGPAGSKVEWDAETTEERENERLAWALAAGRGRAKRGRGAVSGSARRPRHRDYRVADLSPAGRARWGPPLPSFLAASLISKSAKT